VRFLLGELEQNARSALRVEEGNAAAAGTGTGYLIHQAIAGRSTRSQRGFEIGDAIADVMDARSALGQESGNGTRRVGGGQ
jgi:hypothetical protein